MKFSIKDFFSKCDQIRSSFNEKLTLMPFLCSNLISVGASHYKKHLFKSSFPNDIWFPSYVKLKLWWCLYTTCCGKESISVYLRFFRGNNREWMSLFYSSFAATMVDSHFDDLLSFKMLRKCSYWCLDAQLAHT